MESTPLKRDLSAIENNEPEAKRLKPVVAPLKMSIASLIHEAAPVVPLPPPTPLLHKLSYIIHPPVMAPRSFSLPSLPEVASLRGEDLIKSLPNDTDPLVLEWIRSFNASGLELYCVPLEQKLIPSNMRPDLQQALLSVQDYFRTNATFAQRRTCTTCPVAHTFANIQDLRNHISRKCLRHLPYVYSCKRCHKRYAEPKAFRRHCLKKHQLAHVTQADVQ